MACAAQSMLSASSCAFPSHGRRALHRSHGVKGKSRLFTVFVSAGSSDDSDCNVEECAPEKEVGKVSVEWLAGEKTKIVGTFPPGKKSWTGYVEKDTAGQTNIYSVEPAVYVAESALSSGSAGRSADGSENTAAIAAGLALLSIAAASSVLIQVSKNTPPVQTTQYSGPPLSYYINKFKPVGIVEAALPSEPPPNAAQQESSLQPPQLQAELDEQQQQQESQTQDVRGSS